MEKKATVTVGAIFASVLATATHVVDDLGRVAARGAMTAATRTVGSGELRAGAALAEHAVLAAERAETREGVDLAIDLGEEVAGRAFDDATSSPFRLEELEAQLDELSALQESLSRYRRPRVRELGGRDVAGLEALFDRAPDADPLIVLVPAGVHAWETPVAHASCAARGVRCVVLVFEASARDAATLMANSIVDGAQGPQDLSGLSAPGVELSYAVDRSATSLVVRGP